MKVRVRIEEGEGSGEGRVESGEGRGGGIAYLFFDTKKFHHHSLHVCCYLLLLFV